MKKLIVMLLIALSISANACGDFLHGSFRSTPCTQRIISAVEDDDKNEETDAVDEDDEPEHDE